MSIEPSFRTEAPRSGPIRPFHVPPVQTERMENGLEVRAVRRAAVPLVSVALVLDAGETAVSPGHEGLAVLTGDALLGGTARLPAAPLAEEFDRLGTGLRISTGWDATTISFTCLAERAGRMLALASEVAAEPSFPDLELDRVRSQQIANIRQARMQPGRIADDALATAMFAADEPYHRRLSGDEVSVAKLAREDAEAFRAGRFRPGSAGLAVVGDLSPDQVVALAEKGPGSWPAARAEPVRATEVASIARRVVVVNRPGAVQSEIRVGHAGPRRGHPDEISLRVTNTVLGGAFTSRLNMSLREKHGFTYGVRSGFSFYRMRGAFTVGTAVQTEVTAAALAEMMRVIERFASDGPTGDELARARDYLAGVFPLQMETTAQLAARLAGTIVHGLPSDYYQTYRDQIRAVMLNDAIAATQAHIAPSRMSVVVVGDAARVSDEVGALGLGPVEVVEP